MSKKAIITINDLEFNYKESDFNLSIPELRINDAEHVALVGHSGTGKTTLVYLMTGITKTRQGEIYVLDKNIVQMSEVAVRDFRISNFGFIFQEFELLDYLNVEENILLPYFVNDSLEMTKQIKFRASQLAEQVGLLDKIKRTPSKLSQGEKQRVAVCRALITNPSIIIGDEPTGNLDSDNADFILDLIQRVARENTATFIMITHQKDLLEKFDRTIDIEQFKDIK